jgi:glycosyltransferase involved in cell wall biosynthesis
MKVAQILYSGLGGHGSVALSLIAADATRQWRHALGFVGVEPLLPAYRDACARLGVEFGYFGAPPARPWRAWRRLFRWLCDSRPDAVILHSPSSLPPVLGYALVSGVRPVVVEHQANALKRRTDWAFGAAAMVFARTVVVLTPDYRRELQGGLGRWFRGDKVVTIPNGIDVQKFCPRDHAEGALPQVRLGMAARFTRSKRQDVLVDAMGELLRLRPDLDWRLELAGDGDTCLDVAAKARASGLGPQVTLLGALGEDALAAWLRSIDVYLFASDGETLSTSLLQAMACELPIVGSDVAGVAALIGGDAPCGLLVRDQDPRGFARAVLALVDDGRTAKNLGRVARNRCLASYTNGRMFSDYRRLVGEAAAPSAEGRL